MNRDPTGYDGTRDPIYLGQWRELNIVSFPDWCESIDCDLIKVDREHDDVPEKILAALDDDDYVSWSELANYLADSGDDRVVESWRTECVFLTRAEGEAWMKAREYRWPGTWQVYCACAEGKLARVLNDLPEPVADAEIERLREGGAA